MAELNYRQLFAFLEELGFEELCTDRDVGFYHERSQVMFTFSGVDNEQPVREADLSAVQLQLESCGMINGELADQLESLSLTSASTSPSFLSRPWSNV